MCENDSVQRRRPLSQAADIPSPQLGVSWPLCRACRPSTPRLCQLLHPWGGLGAGGRGCSYLPLEQGRKPKFKDTEKAELRWKHKILLSPHRNLRETVAKRWLFVGGKSESVSHSVLSDSVTPWMEPTRLLCPWRFSRQEYWSGLPCPPPGDLPHPGNEPGSPTL